MGEMDFSLDCYTPEQRSWLHDGILEIDRNMHLECIIVNTFHINHHELQFQKMKSLLKNWQTG